MLCLRWAQLGGKLSPKCSKLWHVRLPCAPHCFNLRPNLTNLGSSWVQDSATWGPSWASLGAARAQVGPNPANFADSLRHAEDLHFYPFFFPTCFSLRWRFVLGCLAHFGPVLGLTSVPNNPTNALYRKGQQRGPTAGFFGFSYGILWPQHSVANCWPPFFGLPWGILWPQHSVANCWPPFFGIILCHNIRWPTVGRRLLAILR